MSQEIIMMSDDFLDQQRIETRLTIDELIDDGSDPDAIYTIEHHLSADDFSLLETTAMAAFQQGYDVTDIEKLQKKDGSWLMCFDVICKARLQADILDAQVMDMVKLAKKFGVDYDGWGTYFEGTEEETLYLDEDDDGKRH